jgi:very-short-patch-repair endonuclease
MSIRGGDGRVDALIEDWGLVVEADSRRWHTRVGDFEADRQRDNDLIARGFRVVRFTYQMLKEDSEGCVRIIIQAGTHE